MVPQKSPAPRYFPFVAAFVDDLIYPHVTFFWLVEPTARSPEVQFLVKMGPAKSHDSYCTFDAYLLFLVDLGDAWEIYMKERREGCGKLS